MNVDNVLKYLVCPKTKNSLVKRGNFLWDSSGKNKYKIINNKIYFIDPVKANNFEDSFKFKIKKFFGNFYHNFLVKYFGPGLHINLNKLIIKYQKPGGININLGSGNQIINSDFLNLDFVDYENVDIICDLHNLPFKNNSIDFSFSYGVLEHLRNVYEVENEIFRVSKKKSATMHIVPFLYPYHASPHDFFRFTIFGMNELFSRWSIVHQFNIQGPFSLLIILITRIFSNIFSFNIGFLRILIFYLILLIIFPIKYLDYFFINKKNVLEFSPVFLNIFTKN